MPQGLRRLALAMLALLVFLGFLILTPAGSWFAAGVEGAWQGLLRLPGIAWAREQANATPEPSTHPSPKGDEAVDEILGSGLELQQGEQYEEALRRYNEALNLNRDYAPTHLALASVYTKLGRTEDALKEMARAAELAPDNPVAQDTLGQLYVQNDRYDEAVAAFRRAIELAPDNAEVRYRLGRTLHMRSFVDAQNAVEELNKSAELAPDEAAPHFYLAMAYMRRDDEGDKERAVEQLNKTLELDSTQTESYYYLGQLYFQLDRPDEAITAWRQYAESGQDAEAVARVREFLAQWDKK